MKLKRLALATIAVAGMAVLTASAADETRTWQVRNRLRVEYDDNVYEREKDKQDSFKIIEEIEFLANLNFQQTFLGLRYRPTYVWWSDRDPDDTDFHHDVDVVFAHNFSPRLTLNLKDTLRLAQEPKEIDRGAAIRERDDFTYNVADGSLNYLVSPQTRVDLGGRYTLIRYDRSEIAKQEDYDIYAAGLTLRQDLSRNSVGIGELRYESTEYDRKERGSESEYAGLGLEQIFSPNLLGSVRGGVQFKSYEDSRIDNDTAPYVDGSMTYLPSPRTRITAGLGYSMYEADVTSYANQDRFISFISMAYDLTARVSLYGAASYMNSKYKADQSILPEGTVLQTSDQGGDEVTVRDGTEDVMQYSLRASYKVNRRNWLEISWEYLDLNSDLRVENFERNRYALGWRTEL